MGLGRAFCNVLLTIAKWLGKVQNQNLKKHINENTLRRTKAALLMYTAWNLRKERNRRVFEGQQAEQRDSGGARILILSMASVESIGRRSSRGSWGSWAEARTYCESPAAGVTAAAPCQTGGSATAKGCSAPLQLQFTACGIRDVSAVFYFIYIKYFPS